MAVVRRLLLALLIGLWAIPVSAQDVTGIVRGRVTDAGTQQPLPDVQIEIEGTRLRAVTGPDGAFIIVGVPVGSHRVRASRIGHAPTEQIVTVAGGSTMDVPFALERRAIALQDVVTVGYGTQKRQAITGSIATVDADAANGERSVHLRSCRISAEVVQNRCTVSAYVAASGPHILQCIFNLLSLFSLL